MELVRAKKMKQQYTSSKDIAMIFGYKDPSEIAKRV